MNGVPLYWVCRPFAALGLGAVYALMRLRQQVFVVEQQCAYVDADGVDPMCWHLLGWSSGEQLQASLRIVPPGIKYAADASIGRVVTAPEVRGSGLGHELVAKGMLRCRQLHPGAHIRISAQAQLRRFYERFGFAAIGDEYLEDGIAHVEMLKATRERVELEMPPVV
ncbi:MAG TPA: GNAT family N-acetyltransferase [Ideonella sp.]|nr:GNAT family N-acetyltransferase [Ideonella sp.]